MIFVWKIFARNFSYPESFGNFNPKDFAKKTSDQIVRVPTPFPDAFFYRVRYVQVIIYNTHTRFPSAASQVVNMPYTGITVFTVFEQHSFRSMWFDTFARFHGEITFSYGSTVAERLCAYICTHSLSLRKYVCFALQTPFVMTRRQITYWLTKIPSLATFAAAHVMQRWSDTFVFSFTASLAQLLLR